MKCESCDAEHDGKYGSGRFCSSKCARGFSTKNKREEINKKVSERMLGRGAGSTTLMCLNCKKEFEDRVKKKRKFCSVRCARLYNGITEKTKNKLRQIMIGKVNSGTHSGWKSRKGKEPSYPEKFFMEVLDNNNIQYEHEFPCGKYFIDFAIKSANIALEIDGKQHEYAERKESDEKKDKYLIDNGWKVYRIKWKSINSESGKIYIKEQIESFLKFYIQV